MCCHGRCGCIKAFRTQNVTHLCCKRPLFYKNYCLLLKRLIFCSLWSPFCRPASENHASSHFISVARTTRRSTQSVFPLGKFLTLPLKPHIYHLRSRTVLKTPLTSEPDAKILPMMLTFFKP